MNLLLTRTDQDEVCTQGVLTIGDLVLQTLERPWVPALVGPGGTKGISCVPPGIYQLIKHSSEAHPRTWALVNADLGVLHWPSAAHPNARTVVLIHVSNFPSELRGCIAVGMKKGMHSVLQSKMAFDRLLAVVPWTDEHILEIVAQ